MLSALTPRQQTQIAAYLNTPTLVALRTELARCEKFLNEPATTDPQTAKARLLKATNHLTCAKNCLNFWETHLAKDLPAIDPSKSLEIEVHEIEGLPEKNTIAYRRVKYVAENIGELAKQCLSLNRERIRQLDKQCREVPQKKS